MEPGTVPPRSRFTDGRVIGATLDRNGLRPGRWHETGDGWVVLASETGVLAEDEAKIVRKGAFSPASSSSSSRAGPHRSRCGDEAGRSRAAAVRGLGRAKSSCASPSCLPRRRPSRRSSRCAAATPLRIRTGGHERDSRAASRATQRNGRLDGRDTPLAVLTARKPLLYSYFKQLFAQVTNPRSTRFARRRG